MMDLVVELYFSSELSFVNYTDDSNYESNVRKLFLFHSSI